MSIIFLITVLFLIFGGLMPEREPEVQNNLHISNNGYTYEENLLHFPLYPLMVNGLSNTFNWLFKDMVFFEQFAPQATPSVILFTSVLLNGIFFVFAADRLYYLSRKVLK